MRLLTSIFVLLAIQNILCSVHIPLTNDEIIFGFEPNHNISTRARRSPHSFKIHVHYDSKTINTINKAQLQVLKQLVGEATKFFEDSLKVTGQPKLHLNRDCKHKYVNGKKLCMATCTPTKCKNIDVPASMLGDCILNKEVVAKGGNGVNAHFVLFVTLAATCKDETMIATAAHCQQGEMDRPIAGYMTVCSEKLKIAERHREMLVSTFIHEIIHALAFSPSLYAFYRDKNGSPRTKRLQITNLPLNRKDGFFIADETTIKHIKRKWFTYEGNIDHPISMIVTENVQREVRKHFSCQKLEGVELEDQGGAGTKFAHFEKRIFENEAMCGSHTQDPIFSRITFALLQDSGWYIPDYSKAGNIYFGKGLGCDFAMNSCANWINSRREMKQPIAPYCDVPQAYEGKRVGSTKCSEKHDSVRSCNLIQYGEPMPPKFRPFNKIEGIPDEKAALFAGTNKLADYCPFYKEFEWDISDDGKEVSDSRCSIEENNKKKEKTTFESFSKDSICLNYKNQWKDIYCNDKRVHKTIGAGCHRYKCENKKLYVGVTNGNETKYYWCPKKGTAFKINRKIDKWVRVGTIVCPDCSLFCDGCVGKDTSETISDPKMESCPNIGSEVQRVTNQVTDFVTTNFDKLFKNDGSLAPYFISLAFALFFFYRQQ